MGQPTSPATEIHDLTKYLTKSIEVVTKTLLRETVDEVWAHKAYAEASGELIVQNELACVAGSQLFLIGKSGTARPSGPPVVMLWLWKNRLHPTWTLSIFRWDHGVVWRASIPHDSKELALIRSRPIRVVLLNDRTCAAALEIDFPAVDPQLWSHYDRIDPGYRSLEDELGGKILALSSLGEPSSPQEHLRKGWATKMENQAGSIFGFLGDSDHAERLKEEKERLRGSQFGRDDFVTGYYKYCLNQFSLHSENPAAHLLALCKEFQDKECPLHRDAAGSVLKLAWFSAKATNGGMSIPSVDLDGTVCHMPLDIEALGDRCKYFWERLPLQLPMYHREILGAGSCPVEPTAFLQNAPIYQGDLEAGGQFVSNLMAEALSLKQWTIPYGAYVLLDAGEMEAVKLHEIGQEIAAVVVDRKGDYFQIWVNPRDKTVSLMVGIEFKLALDLWAQKRASLDIRGQGKASDSPEMDQLVQEFKQRFELGLKILLAGIVRDFWVAEERERIFGSSSTEKRTPRLRGDRGTRQIVYLPRIRYVGDCQDSPEGLNLVARAPHFVVGHLRKALKASEQQIILAKQYGIIVPEGFTFVKPHRRGEAAQERIYRSRSALQCLRALKAPLDDGGRDSWFTFELRVREWLMKSDFEVTHIAASRRGDGGVDIQASRVDEHLLVQCKYWQTQKIGPGVIRELLGTLQTFPAGSKGVLVTSSELTEAAMVLATQHGIQFIERVNFRSGIDKQL